MILLSPIECSPSSVTPPEPLTTEEMDTESRSSPKSVALSGRGIITQPQTVTVYFIISV